MKRDMDLIRKILLKIEGFETSDGEGADFEVEGYDKETVMFHLWLLEDAKLIDAINIESLSGLEFMPRRLTWIGAEFLDSARDNTLWSKAMNQSRSVLSSASFELLKAYLVNEGKRLLGIPV